MLPSKIKLSNFRINEMLQLQWLLEATIVGWEQKDRYNREDILMIALVKEILIMIKKKMLEPKQTMSITLSIPQATAFWIAYEKGYIRAKNETQAFFVLQNRCNYIDQKLSI